MPMHLTAPAGPAFGRVPCCDIRRVLAVVRWPVGAVRTRLLHLYPAAAAAGWRFSFVGPADGSLDELRDALHDMPRSEYLGVPVHGRACRLAPAVRALLRDGGFALLHSHGLRATAHAAAANVGLGVPHVATLHEPLSAARFAGTGGRLERWALGRLLARPDAVVTAGGEEHDGLIECFPALAGRVTIVHDGARLAAHDGRRRGDGAGTAVIGCFGGFTPPHGFSALLEAVRRLADDLTTPPFHVAAFGPADDQRAARRELERCGLANRIILRDAPADAGPAVRGLDLVVAASAAAETRLAAMAAMAAGVPVLGVDAPGLREALRGTPSRTVAPGDASALCHGLRLALTNPWTEAARGYAAAARERFDVNRSARRLIDLFDRLTGKAPTIHLQGPEYVPNRAAA